MVYVPRDTSDECVINIARQWIEVLATGDYESTFSELGYLLAFDEPGAACIQRQIKDYRSPYYPGVDDFNVTSRRTAKGGNPAPRRNVTWLKPNKTGIIGAVEIDLPLNGKWSNLTADFVFFENENAREGWILRLEEIRSTAQMNREQS